VLPKVACYYLPVVGASWPLAVIVMAGKKGLVSAFAHRGGHLTQVPQTIALLAYALDRRNVVRRYLYGLLFILCWAQLFQMPNCSGQSAPPEIFFTDLISGPNSGGESVSGFAGAYVTLYGNFFGSSQGTSTVTWNGITPSCLRVVSWGTPYLWYQKIVVQLGAGCAVGTGNFVVTVNGNVSNGISFTVNSSHIYCVATSGNDNKPGTFSGGCYATLLKGIANLAAGDVVYALNGITLSGRNDYGANLWVGDAGSGTSGNLKSLVAYPGATVTIGTTTDGPTSVRGSNFHGANDYWLIAGLTLISAGEAADLGSANGWRFVANIMTCPNGSGAAGCFHPGPASGVTFYGNYVHDVGNTATSGTKLYHAVYFTTNTNHVDMGWNLVDPNPTGSAIAACRGVQFYSTGGADQYDIHVHDNVIRNTICDGLNMASVDPDTATVEAYNNVIYHVGTGPDPADGAAHYSCLLTASFNTHTNPVQIYNNTFYDCGSRAAGGGTPAKDSGGMDPTIATVFTNNIMYELTSSSESYLNPNANPANLSGSNNLWFGAGAAPSQTSANVTTDPLFVSLSAVPDFHLQATSPAIDAGKLLTLSTDKDGIRRPQGAGFDIGAYEYFAGGTTVQRPNPPTNLSVIVK
jgi:hypothetical protein